MCRRLALATALLWAISACDRNIAPYVEGELPREPDLARIFPDSGDGPGAGNPQAGVTPDSPRTGAPAGMARMPAPSPSSESSNLPNPSDSFAGAASDAAAAIHGSIEIASDLVSGAPQGATLFVIARHAGVAAGPPLAVRRIASPSLPLDFEIGPQHAMIQGIPFAGEIQLSVRLDGDGDAMTRRPGDLSGSAEAPVAPGTRGVRILLDERI